METQYETNFIIRCSVKNCKQKHFTKSIAIKCNRYQYKNFIYKFRCRFDMTRFHHDLIIPDVFNHQVEEEKIIRFWRKEHIFDKLRKTRREENDGKLSFHSAPVSPSDHPHSGHILNGVVKDFLKRYGYQKNLRVENRFRWDSHGLAIQYKVDRNLNITLPGDYDKVDAKLYNDHCRAVVEEQIDKWNDIFESLGNCVEVETKKQYNTSNSQYIQGVWKVFKKLYDKGLIYRDTKVLPYSTGCFMHLSDFEANQNLKEISEIGFTIALSVVDSNEKVLVWTTNPWALTLNSELFVNPKEVYVKVQVKKQVYILAKSCINFVFRTPTEYIILEEVVGKSLEGLKCKPLYESITPSAGFRVCRNSKTLNTNIGSGIMPSDEFAMQPLEDGQIINIQEIKHKKPHCPQTDTLLISKKVESWFLRVENISESLIENISSVNWLPDGSESKHNLINYLKEHPADWSISRNRHWGTPLPVWTSASGDEIVCIESLDELKRLSGRRDIPDLHREFLDSIRIPSQTPGNPPLRRVPDVFDGWFETSVLPFVWEQPEQADLVVEGNNHTQGWFYTMLVIATALSEATPFRNVLAHGLTLKPDGSRMNKRIHNRHDLMKLHEKYGADAVRLYLLSHFNENFAVEENGVAEMSRAIIQPLFRIFHRCTGQMASPNWCNYGYITDWSYQEPDPLDRCLLSYAESTLKFYIEEMNSYRLNTFLPKVIGILKQIEEWYIPLRCPKPIPENVTETYANTMGIDNTTMILFNVIYRLCLVLAPFAPFLTEFIFQFHRKWMVYYRRPESIHCAELITPDSRIIKPDLERDIERMLGIVRIVQQQRNLHMIPIDYIIHEVTVVHHSEKYREGIVSVKESFKKMMNTRVVEVSDDYKTLGATLKVDLKESSKSTRKQAIVKELNEEKLNLLLRGESLVEFDEEEEEKEEEEQIQLDDLDVSYEIPKEADNTIAMHTSGDLLVVVKMNKFLLFYEEGTVKELVHQICAFKKRNNYYRNECVSINYFSEDECLKNVIAKHGGVVNRNANCKLILEGETEDGHVPKRVVERLSVKGAVIEMYLDVKCD